MPKVRQQVRRKVAPSPKLHLKKRVILRHHKTISTLDARCRALVDCMDLAAWMGDRNERTIYANKKFCDLVGYTLREMLGRFSYDFCTSESAEIIKENNKKYREKGLSSSYEIELLTKSGKTIPVRLNGTPLPDGGTVGIMEDLREIKKKEKALQKQTHDLEERNKELNCLYLISKLIEKPEVSLEEISQGAVDAIPLSLQYPEITCARIVLNDQEFKTKNFKKTHWKQTSVIRAHDKQAGVLEVGYLKEMPKMDEGPFLKEEKNLINAIAERLGKIIERNRISEDLANRMRELQVLYQVSTDIRMVTPLKKVLKDIVKDVVLACDEVKPARARVAFDNKIYTNLKKDEKFLSKIEEPIKVLGKKRGSIEVGYAEKIANKDSFLLKQEKKVLRIVAQTIGKHIQSREIMKRYQKLINKSVVGIFIAQDDVFQYVNPKFARMFKFKEKEIIGLKYNNLISECTCYTKIKRNKKLNSVKCTAKGKLKDGALIDLEVYTQRIDYYGRPAILGTVKDITKVKEAEERQRNFNKELKLKIAEKTKDLEEANRRLRSLNELKDEFIAVTSHELRSPLTSIRGYLSFLVDEGIFNEISENSKDYMRRIYDNVEVLNNLVNNILDVSRIEMDRFELHQTPNDIINLIQNVIENLRFQANEKGLKVHFVNRLEKNTFILKFDEVRIRQVLRNILDNAIKYSPHGKQIQIELKIRGIGLQISIIDEGVGIPKSQIFEIFDKFKQAKNIQTRFKGGAGLGLFIAKKIIELHGGMIWAESEIRKGTTFKIQLPLD